MITKKMIAGLVVGLVSSVSVFSIPPSSPYKPPELTRKYKSQMLIQTKSKGKKDPKSISSGALTLR